jgi:diguanylate cyclase (GGDEF)-like protein
VIPTAPIGGLPGPLKLVEDVAASGNAVATARPVTPGESFQSRLDWLTRIGALMVTLTGALVLFAWIFHPPALTRLLPGMTSMKVNTSVGLLAAGVALGLLHTCPPTSWWFRLARMLAVGLAVLGGLTLAEDLLGLELGIDQFIVPDVLQGTHTTHPGRMAPAAAFNLIVIGFALQALRARRPYLAAFTHWLIVAPLLVSGLAILGYTYGVSVLYKVGPYTSMALHTALAFLVLTLSVLAADKAHGFARISISDTDGGLVSRRLLPTLPIMLFALGWLRLEGQQFGLYDWHFGLALMVLMSMAVSTIAVAWTAITLHRVDTSRKLAQAEILSFNAVLELRVQERTQELAQVSAQLRLVNSSLELLSRQDALTGLANRRFLDAYLSDQIDIARRYHRPLALVLCDVDCFKAYNDHYGHPAGDACLKRVAAALQSCCRRTADMAARYGGEEFALILPETGLIDAMQIAEAAREAVAKLAIAHEKSRTAGFVTISGGTSVWSAIIDTSPQQLILAADQALFQAKRLGRNRVVSADAEATEVSVPA